LASLFARQNDTRDRSAERAGLLRTRDRENGSTAMLERHHDARCRPKHIDDDGARFGAGTHWKLAGDQDDIQVHAGDPGG